MVRSTQWNDLYWTCLDGKCIQRHSIGSSRLVLDPPGVLIGHLHALTSADPKFSEKFSRKIPAEQ